MDAKPLTEIIQKLDKELTHLTSQSDDFLNASESAAGLCWLALNA